MHCSGVPRGLALSACFVVLLLCAVDPVASRAVSQSDPNKCTVCIKRAPHYVSHTNIQWSQGGKICVRKTFSRRDDWLMEDCGAKAVAELETIADLPTCEVCHENSSQVEAWHRDWTQEDGSQCASAEFVPKS